MVAPSGGPPSLVNMQDLALSELPRGPELDNLVGGALAARAGHAMGTRQLADAPTPGSLTVLYDVLQARHPDWDVGYWEECRALYAGGKRLLGNPAIMARLFPANLYEPPKIYEQRKARAHYFPYAGTIIDSLLAGLSSDPLRVAFGTIDEETGDLVPAANADWWRAFVEDVTNEATTPGEDDDSADGDDDEEGGLPLHHFLIEVMREAEQTRSAWIKIELPVVGDDVVIDSALAEEKAGARSPYLCIVPAETVIDWEYDSTGKILQWVLTLEKTCPRPSISSRRGALEHHVYTLWTQTDWVRYEIEVNPKSPPPNDQPIRPTAFGPHSFECVPFDRITLPEGLWAMGKLHSLSREHLNKRCAMSWAEYKALFSVLYEFLDDEGGSDIPTVGSPDRATEQTRSQGYSQLRRKGDTASFIGPDVAPFKEARESCNDVMREMHRVMFSMALSANMDAAAIQRSGDSKEQDHADTQVILMALGLLMRRISRVLLALVARGRGEPVPQAMISGLEHFDTAGISSMIADAVAVFTGIPMKSKTMTTLYLAKLYRKIMGDEATDAQIQQMREEVEDTIDAEELIQSMMMAPTPGTDGTDKGAGDGADGKDDGDDTEEKPLKPGAGGIKSKQRMKP